MLMCVSGTGNPGSTGELVRLLTSHSPIVTYKGKGVKKDVAKDEHAIVYTTRDAPNPSPDERPKRGEKPMRTAIRVQTDERGDKLAEMSRIDYGRVYTVEHNIKAMAFGWIHEDSRRAFHFDFLNVFMGDGGYDAWVNQQQQAREAAGSDESGDSEDAEDNESEGDDEDDDDDDQDDHGRSGNHRQRTSSQRPRSKPSKSADKGKKGFFGK